MRLRWLVAAPAWIRGLSPRSARKPRPSGGARPGPGDSPASSAAPDRMPGGAEVKPWRYAYRQEPRPTGGRARRGAWLAAVPLTGAALVVLAGGWASAVGRLGGAVPVGQGSVEATWTVPAAFVHPGVPVVMPAAGRVLSVAPEGVVAAGAPLVTYKPTGVGASPEGLPAWARWDGGQGRVPAAPSGWVWARRPSTNLGICLRRACAGQGRETPSVGPLQVQAPQSGWYFPGWDPLAALSSDAWSDIPPGAARVAPVPLGGGMGLAAGAPAGVLGSTWTGLWLLDLPASARPALAIAGSADISWPSGGAMSVQFQRSGPDVAGRFLAAFAADAPGQAPGPPARGLATLTLGTVQGQIIPSSALLPGAGAVGVWAAPGRPERVAVHLLALSPQWAAVADLPAGARVVARPWVLWPWLAGSG